MARHIILRHAGTAMLVTAVGLALFAFPTGSLGGGLPAGVNTARRQVPPASTTIEVPIAASSDDGGPGDAARLVVTYEELASPSPEPDWSAYGGQQRTQMGRAATSAGDVNGDGFDDLLVGSEWYDNGEIDEGRVCIYHGAATGLDSQPAWCAESDVAGALFGASASTAGDVNGDGYADVIVGAPWYDNGEDDEGCAYLYHGSPDGLAANPAWTWESNQAGALAGLVSTAGDVNDDGYVDVLVGGPRYDSGQVDEGKVFLFLGSQSGIGSIPAWSAELNQAGAQLGLDGSAGDVNGDGYDDVILAALFFTNGQYREGGAFLYLGSPAGLAPAPAWTAKSNQSGAQFGTSVATAGDVNADGYDDVVVGARYFTQARTHEGAAFVYQGSATGLSSFPAWMAVGGQDTATFGMFTSTAGDTNGDGFDDVLISAPSYDAGQVDEGRVYLFRGSETGLETTAAWSAEGEQDSALFGYSGRGYAGDVDGDGYGDIAVGALWYDQSMADEGAVFVYRGTPTSAMAVSLTSFEAASRSGQTPGLPVAAMLILALVALGAQLRKGARGGHAWLACFW